MSEMRFIDLKTQYQHISDRVNENIQKVLEHGQYIMGPEVLELETQLADFVGSKHCVGVSNGSDALLIALLALDIRPGDEVITTAFSFIATASMIKLAGAKPVFVDIDPKTYNINPELIKQAITPKTKAILTVSLYGQCADMSAINRIAAAHNLPVIEDAAQSLGATQNGAFSCNLSTIACTSFFPSKPLGCYGDGGACFTNDPELALRMKQIRLHGQERRYHHVRLGINGRLDTLQAAILLAKLPLFKDEIVLRDKVANRYNQLFENVQHVITPRIMKDNTSVYAQYTVRVKNREELQQALKQAGIPTAVHYPVPMSEQPVLADDAVIDCPEAELAASEVMSLPMHPYLELGEQEKVVNAMKRFYQ